MDKSPTYHEVQVDVAKMWSSNLRDIADNLEALDLWDRSDDKALSGFIEACHHLNVATARLVLTTKKI